ncbi:hypothetical protein [Anabaena sp. CCY 9613]|uniref:hypothetical protein n=1 Tax=Anabaena sp. CCY 9613 TaxID=3103868 RepID=UPI0039C743A5
MTIAATIPVLSIPKLVLASKTRIVDLQTPQDITIAARVESIEGPPPSGVGGPHRVSRPKQ